MKVITYRDLEDENMYGYQLEDTPTHNSMVLKEQVIPGLYGFLPIYIRHIRFLWGDERASLIISQTNDELTEIKRAEIVKGARKFLSGLNH